MSTTPIAYNAFHDRRKDGNKKAFGIVCPKCAGKANDPERWSFVPVDAVDADADCGFCDSPWDPRISQWSNCGGL